VKGQLDGFLHSGYGPSHLMSGLFFSGLIGSDEAVVDLHVFTLDLLDEEDPDLKLGFTFYLPLIFITTLVAATVVINYHRREME